MGQHSYNEIVSQPDVWRSVLADISAYQSLIAKELAGHSPRQFTVIGCGSTHYLAQGIAEIMRKCGLHSLALPSADLHHFPGGQLPGESFLLAISRSGVTTETLWAVTSHKENYPDLPITAITTAPDSPLAGEVDIVLAVPQAQETSLAQTRSFTSMYILGLAFTHIISQNHDILASLQRLPDTLDDVMNKNKDLARQIGEDETIDRIFYLGGGPLFGLASEAMLKTKEMALSWSEAYHPLELRHGPMSLVDENTLVVGFISDAARDPEIDVLADMKHLGARTLAIVEDETSVTHNLDHVVGLRSGMSEWERGVLYLPIAQMIAYHRALTKGMNPDQPRNLTQVIEL